MTRVTPVFRVIDHGPRIAELDREIRNIGDAIAKGLVSAALAARLQAAEAERGRLMAARAKLASEPRMLSPETIERRIAAIKRRLAQGGDVARSVLRELFPHAILVQPDPSGAHLWAEFPAEESLRVN